MVYKVQDNECFIPKEALSLIHFSSKDHSRPVLSGFHIKDGEAECVDGFVAGRYKVGQGKDFPECVIPTEDLKVAGVNITSKGLTISINEGLYIITGKYRVLSTPISTIFPDTNNLFESSAKSKVQNYVGLSVHTLHALLAGMKSSGHDYVCLRINETNPELRKNPSLTNVDIPPLEFCTYVSSQNDDYSGKLTGLIMPCSINPTIYNWASNKFNKDAKPTIK
jgi:hypothetical protein